MNLPIRLTLAFLVFLGTYVLSWLVLLLFLPFGGIEWLGNLLALVIAIIVGRIAWLRSVGPPDSALGFAAYGAKHVAR